MTASKLYFLELISAYINERQPKLPPNDVNWDEIVNFARIHSVQVMVYLSVDKLEEKPPVYEQLKAMFFAMVNVSAKQEYEMNRIIKAFNENKLDMLLFKGFLVRELYPDKEARSFGDVDFLIKESDRQKSDEVMKSIGFEFYPEGYCGDVWTYTHGSFETEVHTSMIYDKLFSDFDFISYFRNKVQNKQNIHDNLYKLRDEDHYIYTLVHMAKHFYNCGAGVRMFADIAVMNKALGSTLNYDYINDELESIGLSDFANTVYYVCNKYLGMSLKCSDRYEGSEVELMNYILNHGIFGFDGKNPYSSFYFKGETNRLKVIWKRLFPGYESMRRYNTWFADKPRILLPYAYARRAIKILRNKNGQLSEKMDAAFGDKTEANRHRTLLADIGLLKN